MRDIIGIGELGRKTVQGVSLPLLAGQQHDGYVRQNRGEIINEFGGVRESTHYPSGMRPPETLRSLEWGTWVHPGDTEFGGSQTGFKGLERIGNVPAEGMKPAKGAVPAFGIGRVTLDLLGGLGNVPAEGAKPAKGAVPAFGFLQGVQDFFKKKNNFLGLSGLGITVPEAGEKRGYSAADFIEMVAGHKEAVTSRMAKYNLDWMFSHGGDSFKIGTKDRPTSWAFVKEGGPQGQGLTLENPRMIDLKANEFQTFRNDEDKLSKTDVNLYLKLVSVGPSVAEAEELAAKQATADKAIQNAQGAVSAAKSAGIDTSAMEKTIGKAQDSYLNNDYIAATNSANSAAKDAIDAKALKEKQDLERQKTEINNDSTLNQEQKDNMKKSIDDQKAKIDADRQTQKDEIPKPTAGAISPIIVVGIGVGIAAIAGLALALSKKK